MKRLLIAVLVCAAVTGCATRLAASPGVCLLVEFAFPTFRLLSENGVTLTDETHNPLRTE